MIGLHLHTFHSSHVPCDDTVGIYYMGSSFGGGVFKNSACRIGAWGGWTPETNVLTIGPLRAKAGAIIGGVVGYKKNPVRPLLLPSVAVSLDERAWVRATYLPKFKESASGISLSVEYSF